MKFAGAVMAVCFAIGAAGPASAQINFTPETARQYIAREVGGAQSVTYGANNPSSIVNVVAGSGCGDLEFGLRLSAYSISPFGLWFNHMTSHSRAGRVVSVYYHNNIGPHAYSFDSQALAQAFDEAMEVMFKTCSDYS